MDTNTLMQSQCKLDDCTNVWTTSQSLLDWGSYAAHTSSSPSKTSSEINVIPPVVVLSSQTIQYIFTVAAIASIYLITQQLSRHPRAIAKILKIFQQLFDIFTWFARCGFHAMKLLPLLKQENRPHPIYMLDYCTFKSPTEWHVPTKRFEKIAGGNFKLPKPDVEWCCKLVERSGIGEESAFPPGILDDPPHIGIKDARAEAKDVIFNCCDNLFKSTGIKPNDIDILIVNCSLFVPTPSLCAMIINHYHMRTDIQSYNLGGMGCSAGVISLHLARDLLQVYRNSNALIISTENITQNIYLGRKKSMLISNSLFRVGGAAILLSNRTSDKVNGSAQMELMWTSRTHMGKDSTSYNSVWQDEDEIGFRGVSIDKRLTDVAGKALQVHLTILAPWLLTWKELSLTILFIVLRTLHYGLRFLHKILSRIGGKRSAPVSCTPRTPSMHHSDSSFAAQLSSGEIIKDTKQQTSSTATIKQLLNYMPSFHNPATRMCVHAGGKSVLDGIQKALKLPDSDVASGRFVLHQFGNVSSASVWYELESMHKLIDQSDTPLCNAVAEFGVEKVTKGQKIWQLAFGSGFKVNSAMWKVLR